MTNRCGWREYLQRARRRHAYCWRLGKNRLERPRQRLPPCPWPDDGRHRQRQLGVDRDGGRIRVRGWLRGGTSPEVEQVTFELSSDEGNSYSAPGAGTRVAGGWEVTGLTLPSSGSIRARGRTVGGSLNSSSGLVEQVALLSFLTPLQQWKLTHLGDANEPDLGDPEDDGLPNLVEFAYGLNPNVPDMSALPLFQRSGEAYAVSFATPAGVSGVTYGAEGSSSLLPGSWTATPDTGSAGQHTFSLPVTGARQFLRLKVTAP